MCLQQNTHTIIQHERRGQAPALLWRMEIGQLNSNLPFVFNPYQDTAEEFSKSLGTETITNIPLLFGHILYSLTLSVTIIVVAVPEGLPMMITLVLSSNMKKMLKNNVLVRKLMGIETAGNINVLLTDKTGTLTKGKLEVTNFIDGNLNMYSNINSIDKELYEIIVFSLLI